MLDVVPGTNQYLSMRVIYIN